MIEISSNVYRKNDRNNIYTIDKYRWAGQNIARRGNTKGYENTNTSIKKMINDWFAEYKDANMSFINSYHNHPLG